MLLRYTDSQVFCTTGFPSQHSAKWRVIVLTMATMPTSVVSESHSPAATTVAKSGRSCYVMSSASPQLFRWARPVTRDKTMPLFSDCREAARRSGLAGGITANRLDTNCCGASASCAVVMCVATSIPSIVVLTFSLRMTSSFIPSFMAPAGTLKTAVLLL